MGSDEDCCSDMTNWDQEHFWVNGGLYCLSCGSKIWPEPTQPTDESEEI